ncbi:MAG TPA: single-stranded DNA-binding protein [Immundisolibacter sp.]|nr:single-stranded DNA-binding protein [Immundisolibacter sp.]
MRPDRGRPATRLPATCGRLGIVAFGKLADLLLRHAKGDLLSASGRMQVRRWTDTDGTGREQLQLVADALVSARTVRPGGGRKRAEDGAPFDDGLDW